MKTMIFHKHFLVLAAAVLVFPLAPAIAQDAPPESQLMAPVGDVPQPMPAAAAAPAAPQPEQPQPEPMRTARPAGFDPCPAPQEAVNASPDDLAKVQEDIDRFTLCVARAQLLERLNETAKDTDVAIDSALGLGGVPGVPGAQHAGLAPLPA
ncbi:MAG: hypothetical protein KGQ41_08460, partial [Alphaproteobacteria bacterium]|nr:hypothetical protein [Alphaproteobacteria bacterium]